MVDIYRGVNAKILIGGIEIGCASEASIDIDRDLEEYYEIDTPFPYALVEGAQKISGSLKHAWINIYYLALLVRNSVSPSYALNEFDLTFRANRDGTGPMIFLYNCKFNKVKINVPQDGWLDEDYSFVAKSVAIGTGT
jgi:hypothetical protein